MKCELAEKGRTNTDSDEFKTIKRKYKENSAKTVSISELQLSNMFESLTEEEVFVDNGGENAKRKFHGPRRMKKIKYFTASKQNYVKEVNGGSQGENKLKFVQNSKPTKNSRTPVDDRKNNLRFLLAAN